MKNLRYERQTLLPEVGMEGQERLKQARVLIVGVGGLGSSISLYLAGAGVGTIGLVDDDMVSLHNLHRQILYREEDIGKSKVACAASRLHRLNSSITIQEHAFRLTAANAERVISGYDIIVDGCDNYETRFLLDDVCVRLGKIYVYGAIQSFEGQVAVFNHPDGHVRYRSYCSDEKVLSGKKEEQTGVMGTTAGIVGLVEANEVLKIICQMGHPLIDKLWLIDLLSLECSIISL